MNRAAAYKLLANELALYQLKPFSELMAMVGTSDTRRVHDSGVDYDIAVMCASHNDGIRVCAAIREADWGAPYDVLDEQIFRRADAKE
jgi:hypothetical protein